MRFEVEVVVTLKPGLADPQGAAVEGALPALGWTNVSGVRVGKVVRLQLDAPDEGAARAQVAEMATRLLSNPVIEDHDIGALVPLQSPADRGALAASTEDGERSSAEEAT